jgi:5-methylcytosine-specific restriction endonuclease McrA
MARSRDYSKYCLGNLCNRGHDHEGTGKSLRYKSNYVCVDCVQANRDTEKGRAAIQRSVRNYQASEKYAEWRASEAGKRSSHNRTKRYRETEKGRQNRAAVDARYKATERGRLTQQARRAKRRTACKSGGAPPTAEQLRERYQAFEDRCAYCGSDGPLSPDHVIPLCMHGPRGIENIVPACQRCNIRKNGLDPRTWYERQAFFSQERWDRIVSVLGLTEQDWDQDAAA